MPVFTDDEREPLRQTETCLRCQSRTRASVGCLLVQAAFILSPFLYDQGLPSELHGPSNGHADCPWSSLVWPQICIQRKSH